MHFEPITWERLARTRAAHAEGLGERGCVPGPSGCDDEDRRPAAAVGEVCMAPDWL
ncbi:hypothetical protein [Streptomyces sp. NPDC056452]|uniref:hypothetical protein n=1 Tax=Streptomyces sp. NPDC056452 TaxID=3345821 RepID=UPI0036B513AE